MITKTIIKPCQMETEIKFQAMKVTIELCQMKTKIKLQEMKITIKLRSMETKFKLQEMKATILAIITVSFIETYAKLSNFLILGNLRRQRRQRTHTCKAIIGLLRLRENVAPRNRVCNMKFFTSNGLHYHKCQTGHISFPHEQDSS